MSERVFTRDEAWVGGNYELAMVMGPTDDDRLRTALDALWSFPGLDGGYTARDLEPDAQVRMTTASVLDHDSLYGSACIGSSERIACRSVACRFDGGEDWLSFCLPLGSLSYILPVRGFPFADGGDLAWRTALDEWLCALARHIHESVDFRIALVGWTDSSDLDDVEQFDRSGVPDERWVGYLVPDGRKLQWFAPNQGAPFLLPARRP